MVRIENSILTINYVDNKISQLRSLNRPLTKWELWKYFILFYIKLLVGPIKFNLAIITVLLFFIFSNKELIVALTFVVVYFFIPLIPLIKIMRIRLNTKY